MTTDAGAIGEVAHEASDDAAGHRGDRARRNGPTRSATRSSRCATTRARRDAMAAAALAVVRARHGIDGMLDRMESVFRAAAGFAPTIDGGAS